MATYEELEKEYRKLAKRADQRLVRLEGYKHDKNYATATQWAYAKAQKDIDKWGGTNRFNTKPPATKTMLEAKINDIKNFLDSPTSTKAGITSVYKKRADTINKKYGTNFKWQDLATYYTSGMADKMDSKFGSKTALKTIAAAQKNKKDVIKAIKEGSENHLKLSDSENLNKKVNEFLVENGTDFSKLL